MSSVLRYESYLDETTELFFSKLNQLSKQDGKQTWLDLPCLFQYYAFDAVGILAYGKRYGFIERIMDVGDIIKQARMILDYTSHVSGSSLSSNVRILIIFRLGITHC